MQYVLYFLIAIGATTVGSLTGMGGGVIIKPLMDVLHGFDVQTIGVLSSLTVFSMSVVSIGKQMLARTKIPFGTAIPLALGSVMGGLAGEKLLQVIVDALRANSAVTVVQNVVLSLLILAVFLYMKNKSRIPSQELRGVVVLRDGTVVKVVLGQGNEPKFVITDLLPHLGAEQGKKPLSEAIPGENLNILMGSRPLGEDGDSDRVKLRVLDLLHEKYGICEDDFTSAELEVVPAFNATDLGLDRSLIGAYGHDDRVCSYAALKGLFDIDVPEKTAVCMLADKEEIGSMGVTGMQSAFFDTFMEDLCDGQGVSLRVCYESSFCLSSDVTAAFDPNFAEVYEKRNESRVNYGLGICKYTGARGKSGSSDAGAETVAYVRRVLDEAGVVWQIGEMGKIDVGGGGTVAQYMANRNIDTIDAGVPVLSMHSPFETVGKLDCYMNYLGCKAVYNA